MVKDSSEHVAALFELQNVYSNIGGKAHKTKVRSSMRGVLLCWFLVELIQFYNVLVRGGP
jgi:hypothetical protein